MEIRDSLPVDYRWHIMMMMRVKHFKMIECLSEIGIYDKDVQITSKLYSEQSVCVKTKSGVTSEFKTKTGV